MTTTELLEIQRAVSIRISDMGDVVEAMAAVGTRISDMSDVNVMEIINAYNRAQLEK